MTQQLERMQVREISMRKAESTARNNFAVNEDSLDEVFRAAGARKTTPEARRTLKALVERELARYAAAAAAEAHARGIDEVDETSVAVGAASISERRGALE